MKDGIQAQLASLDVRCKSNTAAGALSEVPTEEGA